MEIKRMYVRTIYGIGKMVSFDSEKCLAVVIRRHVKLTLPMEKIKNTSSNLIEILEVGDVVVTNNLCGEITKIDKENDRIYTTSYDGE